MVECAPKVNACGVGPDSSNRREKLLSLQSLEIQMLGSSVAGGYQNDLVLKQILHKLSQQHCIADIGYKQFVKTQHSILFAESTGDNFQGVGLSG